jgi:3-hydroxyisobutyrate dehydrogenase-like beta-hydroxyacid dehydrogenase
MNLSERIGFIGVGRMGSGMASRLLAAGHPVTVYDPDVTAVAALVARGAVAADSPLAVAQAAPVVMVSLPTPAIVKATVSAIAAATGLQVFVDLSTSGTAAAQSIAATLAPFGVAALDAPVSGGVTGAANGKLAIMVSGPLAAIERVKPLLAEMGKVFVVGERPGLGQTVKLANNMLAAVAMAATSEAMAMGAKAGVDPAVMLEILNASSGRNSATQDKFPRCVINRRFDFGFANALSFKDVRLCVDEAEALGVPMIMGAAVRQMLAITQNVCGPDADVTDMARVVENWAGCQIGSSEEK